MSDEQRNTVLRFAVIFTMITLGFVAVLVKIVYVQTVEREEWMKVAERQVPSNRNIPATRGNILDCNGQLLASSMPQYYMYMDTRVEALHQNNGKLFHEHIDTLSADLARIVGDRSAAEYKARITLPYQPGTLKAVAGNASTTLKTAGEAYAIRLTPDKKVVKADGEDLAFIILEIIDNDGNIVPEAAVPVDIQVSGAGTLLAAGTANLQDTEATTSSHVTTWKGRAMVVVRSTQQKGKINVTTKSKLKNANSLLQSRP